VAESLPLVSIEGVEHLEKLVWLSMLAQEFQHLWDGMRTSNAAIASFTFATDTPTAKIHFDRHASFNQTNYAAHCVH